MSVMRSPAPSLAPFVKTLWAFDSGSAPAGPGGGRERVLPLGTMHLVIRTSPAPLTLYANEAGHGARTVGHSVVGGARSSFYVRDVSAPSRSVGAELHPGAARYLFGTPASALSERHTALGDLWGREAERLRERIALAPTTEAALAVFERALASRLPRARGLHPAVAEALARFAVDDTVRVAAVADATGYSHRRFIELFRDAVGLAPKLFRRVRRFQRAATLLTNESSLADVAATAGYSDQAHLTRDFKEIGGVPPAAYRALPSPSNHVPIR